MSTNFVGNIPLTAQALNNVTIVAPQNEGIQPQNVNGTPNYPAAFFFDYEGEQAMTIESDVTDHFVEDNTAIQDQVALKPEKYVTQGFIGELNDVVPPILKLLSTTVSQLQSLEPFVPVITEAALIAYNYAFEAYQISTAIANNPINPWGTVNVGIDGQKIQTKQQAALQKFYGYWAARRLFTIQTPWVVMNNMIIENCKVVQGADDRMSSTFEITFKKIRFAQTIVTGNSTTIGSSDPTQRFYIANQQTVNLGPDAGQPALGDFNSAILANAA